MRNLNTLKDEYLLFCQNQKCLDEKNTEGLQNRLNTISQDDKYGFAG